MNMFAGPLKYAAWMNKREAQRENINERLADNEVLLNLRIINPWCFVAPFGYVVARDHRSGSTCALTNSFHDGSRSASLAGLLGRSGVYSRELCST